MGNVSTQFKKGFDSRRYCPTNTGLWEFRQKLGDMLKAQSLEAFDYLMDTLKNEKAHPKLRKECAVEILNRSWGVPVSTVHVQIADNNNSGADVTKLSTDDLEAMVAKLNTDGSSKVIEGELVINDAGVYSSVDANKSLKASGVSE